MVKNRRMAIYLTCQGADEIITGIELMIVTSRDSAFMFCRILNAVKPLEIERFGIIETIEVMI